MTLRIAAVVVFLAGCAAGPRPDLLGAQRSMAREAIARKQWQLAFQSADALCRDARHDAEAFVLRGIVYREQHMLPEARADFEEAIRLEERSSPAHSALALLLDEQGDGEAALVHYKRAVELEPRNPGFLNNLAFSLFAHGRPREAIPMFREALRGAPGDTRIRNNLGFAYASTGDFRSAAEQFELGGTPAQARNNLAFAYERRGDLARAFDLYCEALRIDRGATAARANLNRVAGVLARDLPTDLAVSAVTGG